MDHAKVYGFEMARISEVYLSTLSGLMKSYGIERNFFPLIHLCENNGKLSQKELAKALRKDKVSTMRMVDYLSEKGLIVRKQDCKDRRSHLLEVTDKAFELLPIIKNAIEETNTIIFGSFTNSEIKNFDSSMNKLYDTISDLPEPEFIVKAYKRTNK